MGPLATRNYGTSRARRMHRRHQAYAEVRRRGGWAIAERAPLAPSCQFPVLFSPYLGIACVLLFSRYCLLPFHAPKWG